MSYGGYADYNRTNSHFVFKIPEEISSEDAAPMLCGGITVYSPLKQNGCGPGKRVSLLLDSFLPLEKKISLTPPLSQVGIIGVGGLGHFGVLFAKALGASRVVGISRHTDKRSDVLSMGADEYIATSDEPDWNKTHARSLDLIICTVSSPSMPLMKYLQLLRVKGTFIQVGAPEDKLPDMNAFAFIAKGVKFGGSMIGAPHEIEEMLKLAADKGIKPWIQSVPMKEANRAVVDMDAGKARYRITLVNEKFAKA